MKNKMRHRPHEQYHHGPHVRYVVEAMTAGLLIVIGIISGIALILHFVFPE